MTNRRRFLSSAGMLTGGAMFTSKGWAQAGAAASLSTGTEEFADAVDLGDFEALARKRISRMVYEFIASGAGDEITLRWNREAFDRIALWPRTLVDTAKL